MKVLKNRCALLRWKGLYIISGPVEGIDDPSDDTAMWCQHTYKPVGPDGQIVDQFECSPGRPCYEQL